MFDANIYSQRRELLRKTVGSGIILFWGNEEMPMNYPANPYHFRQDSSFLYFFGLDQPGLAAIVDVDQNKDMLFGNDLEIEDIIWMGKQPSMKDRALRVGVNNKHPLNEFENVVRSASKDGRTIHYLPLYRSDSVLKTAALLGVGEKDARNGFSVELIKAIVEQRSIKIAEEIVEMEKAHETTYQMYEEAMKTIKPGLYERDIAGKMEGIVLAAGCHIAFPTILTINGQILHNHYHGNKLEDGRLLVVDSGAESPMNYASDITRTFPVNGKFTPKQKDIYEIVYNAQMSSIKAMKPGVSNKNIHFMAARIIADGLKGMGLMKGNMDDAVDQGAHALFFPHGLGHHIGLDVHDMESYGEDYVGYDKTVTRSDQFGLAYLRMAKSLKTGYVITVEPGIYFIPALIDKWKGEGKFLEFIDYDKVNEYRDFGGVRIEDDILVTEEEHRVLGKSIPKTIDDVEAIMNT